ncbi:MAG TPA: hypothetical protein VMI56_11880 [Reyranella sp.]|nr:hypothetical protein [Reyranella sp.]
MKLLLSLLLTLLALPCQAAPSPEQILEAFFGPDPGGTSEQRSAAYTGEMKERYWEEPTAGQMMAPGRHYTARRLPLAPADAPVYAVKTSHEAFSTDWYAYFVRDDGVLKLRAIRWMAQLGMSCDDKKDESLRLACLPDSDRLAHFRGQLGALDALKAAIDTRDSSASEARMHVLHFNGWEHNKLGQLEIRLVDKVGVLHVPPGEKPPPIVETDHIYIEQISGPWHLYKRM